MDDVPAKISKDLRRRYRELFPEERRRIGQRVVALALEDIQSNGGQRRTGRQVFEVDDDLAEAAYRLIPGNYPIWCALIERFLREEMERLQ